MVPIGLPEQSFQDAMRERREYPGYTVIKYSLSKEEVTNCLFATFSGFRTRAALGLCTCLLAAVLVAFVPMFRFRIGGICSFVGDRKSVV